MPFWVFQWAKSYGNNFGKVTPTIYRSAQPSAGKLFELRNVVGIQAVLNLREDVGPEEEAEVLAAGLLWYPIPMRDDEAPSGAKIRQCLKIMQSGVVTLVQCKGGRHRTGLIVAVYRVVEQKWSKEAAWKEAYDFGFYRYGGHGPIEDWFLRDFKPEEFRVRS